MANRYLRATGNWNGAVWAATSDGAAGSASTPTASDTAIINANYTVTLTQDAVCLAFYQETGRLNLGSHELTIMGDSQNIAFYTFGTNTKTVDLGSGHLNLYSRMITLDESSLNLIAGTSRITMQVDDNTGYFGTGSKVFNDVIINLGANAGGSAAVAVIGSPTFRSLIIQSKNSAAHTVNFDGNNGVLNVSKFVAVGSSSSNKLSLTTTSGNYYIYLPDTGTSYGSYVAANNVYGDTAATPLYLGSNSTDNTDSWLLQDPPKISTLVDPLTAAPGSNPNWMVTGTVTNVSNGIGGGGYRVAGGATAVSTDTYDLVGSSVVVEIELSYTSDIPSERRNFGTTDVYGNILYSYKDGELYIDSGRLNTAPYGVPNGKFLKISLSEGGVVTLYGSDDGLTWSAPKTLGTVGDLNLFRSVRLYMSGDGFDWIEFGSINPELAAPSNANFLQFF